MNQLFTDLNTSFDKQQNPLRTFEFPCDKEYEQMNIGSCSYFLLSEYPADVEVFVSLNPEFKDSFKVDNRNTGFKINDVFTKSGVPSFVKDVYIWTKGITGLTDSNGKPKSVKIITSGIPSFEILNNSSINSIESIGQIGSINGLVGYPQGALTMTGILAPAYIRSWQPALNYGVINEFYSQRDLVVPLGERISPTRSYIISAQGVLDPELVLPLQQVGGAASAIAPMTLFCHTHAGLMVNDTSDFTPSPNKMFSLLAKSFALSTAVSDEGTGTRAFYTNGSGEIDNEFSIQFTGEEILRNFVNSEGNATFRVEIRQYTQRDYTTETTQKTTNTKLCYQMSAYRTGV